MEVVKHSSHEQSRDLARGRVQCGGFVGDGDSRQKKPQMLWYHSGTRLQVSQN